MITSDEDVFEAVMSYQRALEKDKFGFQNRQLVNDLQDAGRRIAELEAQLKDRVYMNDYEKQIAELEAENELYKKDNAYLLEQLPVQKHQKYLEGMERAAEICRQHNNEKELNAQLKLAELAIRAEIEEE
jgi:hypothetical protein